MKIVLLEIVYNPAPHGEDVADTAEHWADLLRPLEGIQKVSVLDIES